jgi:hypothetical protein
MPQGVPDRIELKPAQKRVLDALCSGHPAELTRGAYQELTCMSRSQAAYDLADLVEARILERVGSGRATRYRLAQQPSTAHRRWTSERIRAELKRFCARRTAWPSAQEFKAGGHANLYVAASRYGGIGFWAAELGFRRQTPERARLRSLRWQLSWATAGALLGALAVAALVAVIWPGSRQSRLAAQRPSPQMTVERTSGPTHDATNRPLAAKPKLERRRPRPSTHLVQQPATAVVASRTVAASMLAAAPAMPAHAPVRSKTAEAAPAPSGPTPLPAPGGGAGPPLPLPRP